MQADSIWQIKCITGLPCAACLSLYMNHLPSKTLINSDEGCWGRNKLTVCRVFSCCIKQQRWVVMVNKQFTGIYLITSCGSPGMCALMCVVAALINIFIYKQSVWLKNRWKKRFCQENLFIFLSVSFFKVFVIVILILATRGWTWGSGFTCLFFFSILKDN